MVDPAVINRFEQRIKKMYLRAKKSKDLHNKLYETVELLYNNFNEIKKCDLRDKLVIETYTKLVKGLVFISSEQLRFLKEKKMELELELEVMDTYKCAETESLQVFIEGALKEIKNVLDEKI